MCKEMEKWGREEREAGKAEGTKETRHEVALGMLKKHLPLDMIADISKLSLEQIRKIAEENHLATV